MKFNKVDLNRHGNFIEKRQKFLFLSRKIKLILPVYFGK